jgi:single-strand DNA-binding protein
MLNKVQIIGHCGADPEMRYMPSGDAVANVSVATTEKWTTKDGEKKEKTEWHRCVFFGKLAEIVEKYVVKGGLIYVEGRIETQKWKDKEGNDKYTTQIKCDQMRLLSSKRDRDDPAPESEDRPERQERQSRQAARKEPEKKPAGKQGHFDDMEDDIPF